MTNSIEHLKIALLRWAPSKKAQIIQLFDRADKAGLVEHIELKPLPLSNSK